MTTILLTALLALLAGFGGGFYFADCKAFKEGYAEGQTDLREDLADQRRQEAETLSLDELPMPECFGQRDTLPEINRSQRYPITVPI